jgi:hypothetical protein
MTNRVMPIRFQFFALQRVFYLYANAEVHLHPQGWLRKVIKKSI